MCTAWIRSDGKSAPGYGTPFAKFSVCLHILRSWSSLGRGPANPNFVLPAVRGFLRRRRPRRMEVGLAGTLAKEEFGFTHWLFGISSDPPLRGFSAPGTRQMYVLDFCGIHKRRLRLRSTDVSYCPHLYVKELSRSLFPPSKFAHMRE